MIAYPVRAAGDGTDRVIDDSGQVLGTAEIVAALNTNHESGPQPQAAAIILVTEMAHG